MPDLISCPATFVLSGNTVTCSVPLNIYTVSEQEIDTNLLITTYLDGISNPLLFDVSLIDPSIATALFTAGFLLSIVPWATAWGFSQLLRLLR